jgi:DNA-binding SARP family transcriptional activator/predicted ATPase
VDSSSPKLFLLGFPHLTRQAQDVRIATRKGIGLLAYLALEGVQTRTRLAEIFWGQFDEARGRMNLRRELQRLKDLGLQDLLLVTNSSLQLAKQVWCDATLFQKAALAGDVQSAVNLWSGTLLEGFDAEDDLEFDHWLEQKRIEFEAQHLDALHVFAAQLENNRDLRQALTTYQQILARDNLNETVYQALIRLHGLLGMREQAIATFTQLKDLLREELGLIPLPATIALIEKVKQSAKQGEQLPPQNSHDLFDPPFIGREDVIAQLNRNPKRIHLLLGEPGVGKSRLATEFLLSLGSFVRIQGREDWRGITLAPITAILRENHEKLESLSSSDRLEVARLLPEIEPNSKNLEAPSLEGRTRFLEALANALRLIVGNGALLVDDMHWLDESSVHVVSLLLSASNTQTIFTARETEFETIDHVRISINSLERQGILRKTNLMAWGEIDVLELVRNLSKSQEASKFSERLFDATGGNPFFTLETIRHLFATGFLIVNQGLWQVSPEHANYQQLPIPNSLKTMIFERITRLGAGVQRLLEAASLNGSVFELSDLDGATALGEWDALDALEQSVGAQLIRTQDTGYRFAHDLVRRTLEDGILSERKSRIHRKLANNAITKNALPERIAEHFEGAGDRFQAVNYRYLAAERLEKLNLSQAARIQLEMALQLIGQPNSDLEHQLLVKVHMKLGNVLHDLAEYETASVELERALELARTIDHPGLQSECLSGLARVAGGLSSYAAVLPTCQESLMLARLSLDPIVTARALYWLGNTEFQLGKTEQATEHLIESLELQQQGGELDMFATTNILLGRVATFDQNHKKAIEYYRVALESNRKIGYLKGTALCLTGISWRALIVKNFIEAEQSARESLALYLQLGGPWLIANAMTNLAHALAGKNQHEEAKHHYATALERSVEIGAYNITLEIMVGVAKMLLSADQSLAAQLLALAIQHERSTAEIKDYAAPVVQEWHFASPKNKTLPINLNFEKTLEEAQKVLRQNLA